MEVIVTGATGFVGAHLVGALLESGCKVIAIYRSSSKALNIVHENLNFKRLDDFLSGNVKVQSKKVALIHLIGSAHRKYTDSEAEETNYNLAMRVLHQCNLLEIKKFILLSSVNLYQQSNTVISTKSPASETINNVMHSKQNFERYLISFCKIENINMTIIRAPLVYGENVKANFASLMRLVGKGLPLPFRLIKNNKRSLVSVYNLVDLIKVCIDHPNAANQIFLASDDHDLSTAEMVALMAKVQNKPNLAVPVPVWCFKLAGKLLGKQAVIDRLTGSLQLDITHTKNTLNWAPPHSVEHGFKLAAKNSSKK
tara:strand:- start:6900 stop:7835 length:936 start_codon:yes stop_codon:yes gene_type:complete